MQRKTKEKFVSYASVKEMDEESIALHLLRAVIFSDGHDEGIKYGLIPEDVERVFPQLVKFDESGKPVSIKYDHLPVLLLNELQKQAVLIDDLINRLEDVEDYLEQIN